MAHALIDFPNPAGDRASLFFGDPIRVLATHDPSQVLHILDAVEAHAVNGGWAVGYVRYEAASAFDSALVTHPADGPLVWFGLHQSAMSDPTESATDASLVAWNSGMSRSAFEQKLKTLSDAIAAGEIYQVNLTEVLRGHWIEGSARSLFAALRRAQPGGYAAWIDAGREQILSVSPELFFDWQRPELRARPMKGTAPRGVSPTDDVAIARRLKASSKERAENVMIVDLLRNDMSRVAIPGSVKVPGIFELQAFPTVWQMTSDVQATTRPEIRLRDVFAALFPCGSVTGAPKVQAMKWIRALETTPRGVYCGAIGCVRPGGHATFNVPIRTVVARGKELAAGTGSGITAYASAEGEWQEWGYKRAFLERASAPFDVLETLALTDGCFRHADLHLERMAASAKHFGFPWSLARARQELARVGASHAQGLWRVRLRWTPDGVAHAEAHRLDLHNGSVRLALASSPFEMAHSEFTRHKTTRRNHYDAALVRREGVFDTLLWNTEGWLTECTRGNVALCMDGRWLTPPIRAGLLPGVERAVLLAKGSIEESVLTVGDLKRASSVAFFNSLRGWLSASVLYADF